MLTRHSRCTEAASGNFRMELARNCIKIHGRDPYRVMLDRVPGHCRNAVAAMECGIRKFVGFDIDPKYVEYAKMRVKKIGRKYLKL
jgi:DNA modification methylase